MITNCYIKGRFDNGVGKCAVVITEDAEKANGEAKLLHKVAWVVPESWQYNGETIVADQFNCEILAATYAIQWCMQNNKPMVNIYANTTSCQKWYLRREFPETRKASAKAYTDMLDAYKKSLDEHEKEPFLDSLYVEYIKKDDKNEWNWLVNDLALNVK